MLRVCMEGGELWLTLAKEPRSSCPTCQQILFQKCHQKIKGCPANPQAQLARCRQFGNTTPQSVFASSPCLGSDDLNLLPPLHNGRICWHAFIHPQAPLSMKRAIRSGWGLLQGHTGLWSSSSPPNPVCRGITLGSSLLRPLEHFHQQPGSVACQRLKQTTTNQALGVSTSKKSSESSVLSTVLIGFKGTLFV